MHTCPRRRENGMDDPNSPRRGAGSGLDDYTPRHGLVGQPRGCTYCGSMHPDDFMDAVRTGAEIGPTDKSYKVYVHGLPNPDPEQLFMLSSSSTASEGAVHHDDLTDEQRAAVHNPDDDFNRDRYFTFRTRDTLDGKFYFGHLTEEQGSEFKRLYAEGKVRMGYPGHFYQPVYLPLLPEDR